MVSYGLFSQGTHVCLRFTFIAPNSMLPPPLCPLHLLLDHSCWCHVFSPSNRLLWPTLLLWILRCVQFFHAFDKFHKEQNKDLHFFTSSHLKYVTWAIHIVGDYQILILKIDFYLMWFYGLYGLLFLAFADLI